jgi:hypothetical protein
MKNIIFIFFLLALFAEYSFAEKGSTKKSSTTKSSTAKKSTAKSKAAEVKLDILYAGALVDAGLLFNSNGGCNTFFPTLPAKICEANVGLGIGGSVFALITGGSSGFGFGTNISFELSRMLEEKYEDSPERDVRPATQAVITVPLLFTGIGASKEALFSFFPGGTGPSILAWGGGPFIGFVSDPLHKIARIEAFKNYAGKQGWKDSVNYGLMFDAKFFRKRDLLLGFACRFDFSPNSYGLGMLVQAGYAI